MMRLLLLLIISSTGYPRTIQDPGMDVPVLVPDDSGIQTEDKEQEPVAVSPAGGPVNEDLKPGEDFIVSRPSPKDDDESQIENPVTAGERLGIQRYSLGGETALDGDIDEEDEEEEEVVIDPRNGGDEDDTVVVTAATCPDLLRQCKEENDLLSCQAYNENCTDNEGDDSQVGNFEHWPRKLADGSNKGQRLHSITN